MSLLQNHQVKSPLMTVGKRIDGMTTIVMSDRETEIMLFEITMHDPTVDWLISELVRARGGSVRKVSPLPEVLLKMRDEYPATFRAHGLDAVLETL